MEAMILVAHADDETLGAGGLIQKLAKSGWGVRVVIIGFGKATAGALLLTQCRNPLT